MSIHEEYSQMVAILIERDNLRLQVAALQLQVDELGHINDKQRAALQKYAKRENWADAFETDHTHMWYPPRDDHDNDPWLIAQEALGPKP